METRIIKDLGIVDPNYYDQGYDAANQLVAETIRIAKEKQIKFSDPELAKLHDDIIKKHEGNISFMMGFLDGIGDARASIGKMDNVK